MQSSVPIRTWAADPRIAKKRWMATPPPLIYTALQLSATRQRDAQVRRPPPGPAPPRGGRGTGDDGVTRLWSSHMSRHPHATTSRDLHDPYTHNIEHVGMYHVFTLILKNAVARQLTGGWYADEVATNVPQTGALASEPHHRPQRRGRRTLSIALDCIIRYHRSRAHAQKTKLRANTHAVHAHISPAHLTAHTL